MEIDDRTHKLTLGWFLFGLGAHLQLGGVSLSFTELFIFVIAPFWFLNEISYMRRNGVATFFWLSMAVVAGGAVSCVVNRTPFEYALRGMAVVCLLPCTIVVAHRMLRTDMNGFKWWLIGASLSSVLCTFVFQRAVEVTMLSGGVVDEHTSEAIMSGPIYWIGRLNGFLSLPAKGWYLQCPMWYCVSAPLFMMGFAMLTSVSGRSAALSAIASVALVLIGGKKQQTMRRVGRWFWQLLIVAIIGVFAVKNLYVYAAVHDWLGEDARQKYEQQVQGDTSLKRLLLSGRMESFCGLLACADRPIIGFGPWATDRGGYVSEFLRQYGTLEDYELALKREILNRGQDEFLLPCHAYITQFWLWFGIFGLVFWLYVLFVLVRYLKQDCWAVPQWYMWLAASLPGYCWGIFFSAWGYRVSGILFVVACLMARAVRRGWQPLPFEMIAEIEEANAK